MHNNLKLKNEGGWICGFSESKWNDFLKAVPRIIIAIIIAVIISKPMEIQIFKSEFRKAQTLENCRISIFSAMKH